MENIETSQDRSGGTVDERRSDGAGRREDLYQTEQARGNEAPKVTGAADPVLKRTIAGAEGGVITVEEESGAAWAEGVAPAVHSTAAGGVMPLSQRVTSGPLTVPLLWAGGSLLAALGAGWLLRRRRERDEREGPYDGWTNSYGR